MAPPTPPHPPGNIGDRKRKRIAGNIRDRKRKRIADDGASPSDDPPAVPLPPQNMSTQVTDAAVNAIAGKVGDLVGTLWDYSLGLVANIIFLSRKADEVAEEMEKLRSLRDDLMRRAEDEARQTPANVSNQLERWMGKVSSLAEDVAKFQRSLEDRSSFVTRFHLGYDAVELLKQARKLAEEGIDFSGGGAPLTCPQGRPEPVEQVPSETSSSTLAGGREALQKVEGYIMDDGVGIIGICGMGGVGKTTLLKIINNEFLKGGACRDKFDVAIWVTVSQDVQISNIREIVADRLGLTSYISKDKLFHQLSKKKFILLLDDVWEKLDLTEIGIPLPKILNNGSKILFTTRKEEICGEMDYDQKVKITSLDDKSSWELFQSKFGGEVAVLDDPRIRQFAEEVVRRCGGLPIALVTVGRAMSSAKTAYEWKDAIRKLDRCPAKLSPGMEAVLKSLKFSFDMLKDDALRNCLLYCALFPEDFKIAKEKIIDYWICEGFLDPEDFEEDNIEDTRCRGNVRISELQNACLLEETLIDTDGRGCVNLHDTVRDMALWIARNDFVVLSGSSNVNNAFSSASSSQSVPKSYLSENVKRISLMYNCEIEEPPSYSYPNLTTLLLLHSTEFFANCFLSFASMLALRVLDLDGTSLSEFPIEITSLTSLQYLGLKSNNFTSLPVELGNLTNLRILSLRNTYLMTSIPAEAISRLSRLQVLDMMCSGYKFGDYYTRHPQELELSDLANLNRLSELYLPVYHCSWATLGKIAESRVLQRSTRDLTIWFFSVSSPPPPTWDTISRQIGSLSELRRLHLMDSPIDPMMEELQLYPISQLQNLEHLTISKFINNISSHGLEPFFPRLCKLSIEHCHGCSELTWVGRLPCLEELKVMVCKRLSKLLDGGGGHDHQLIMQSSFPKLKTMTLSDLPSLSSISTGILLFPCLEELSVSACPQLQRLPFGPQSAEKLQRIKGPKAWWDRLEWDSDAH